MRRADDSIVDVDVACDATDVPPREQVERAVRAALHSAGVDTPFEVSVRIVASDEMQALNRRYRDRDQPTNVLSFPAETMVGLPAGAPRPLGDIAVCAEVVQREAAVQGKSPGHHWMHMLVHGTLHLAGFDHETDAEARVMEALEVRALGTLGVGDPYRAA
ncbi:MAG: rRNA maturation RNase YbeY [Woeseiaceae bacterium]|nr:rRNA maturation RNase YbeY [Woeseiaceae bacterium]